MDEPIEPFSPNDSEAYFDDRDVEPEPQEPPPPPVVQPQRLRATPSIQVVEYRTEQAFDSNQECYKELTALRAQVCLFFTIVAFLRVQSICLS